MVLLLRQALRDHQKGISTKKTLEHFALSGFVLVFIVVMPGDFWRKKMGFVFYKVFMKSYRKIFAEVNSSRQVHFRKL